MNTDSIDRILKTCLLALLVALGIGVLGIVVAIVVVFVLTLW